jgi:hypothetical protein
MHACLLHVYDHALLHLLFIVIYHGGSVMVSCTCNFIQTKTDFRYANTKIWHRKESELWAQLGKRICPEEGRFLQKDSAKELAVGSWLPFGKESVCADFVGLRDDVARTEGTNGWIGDRT